MPTNCCVPLCTKKDKRDKETGEKISFFRFPEDEDLMKQWIHAIRRDVGPYFSVNEGTRVCSRHFKTEDLRKSLNGRVSPEPGAISYWLSGKDVDGTARPVKQGRPRTLKPVDEFFLTLCRLRQGFAELHLAHLFNVSQPTVSRIFISWINFLYFKLGNINILPSRELVNETMPEDFKAKYPTSRVITDCTEVRCEMPSSLLLNSELFSSYKHHTTLKALVGISPKGFFTFIGQLYTGSISDREMVEGSGFLSLPFSKGDMDKFEVCLRKVTFSHLVEFTL
ncbi:uncharacterized protein [Porites lutea]|uniref:uncharacterized protein n=1 Tax=Porites lutea TaxID=51062 RepID=UPI003CC5AE8C